MNRTEYWTANFRTYLWLYKATGREIYFKELMKMREEYYSHTRMVKLVA
jgi:hypothetical protein